MLVDVAQPTLASPPRSVSPARRGVRFSRAQDTPPLLPREGGARLGDYSRGELLGLLLAAAKTDDPKRWAHWQEIGDALLAEKGDATG